MASGLLAILDDITVLLDDVALMTKVAGKKTAAIVGDDLAVNANVVVGLEPSRELPIVGKIALGSMANKAILIPLALALPTRVIGPVLMFGGAFLCYEALHKILHKKDKEDEEHHQKMLEAVKKGPEELLAVENKKVWAAIGTDTVLSAEVIAVALGSVATAPLLTKALTLCVVGLAMTIGVYGLVAAIVKVDDLGLYLQQATGDGGGARFRRWLGRFMVQAMPYFMKFLSFLGTVAMLTVGGGIILHGFHGVEQMLDSFVDSIIGDGVASGLIQTVATILIGLVVGALAWPVFGGLGWVFGKIKASFKKDGAPKHEG